MVGGGRDDARLTGALACLVLVVVLVAAACASGAADPSRRPPEAAGAADRSPVPDPGPVRTADARPVIRPVSVEQWSRMVATGVWREECPLGREDLRRVEVDHVGFDGRTRRGVLVVNADVAASVARIFAGLYEARFPIRRMRPLEEYNGNRDASLRDDNTSAYNCRRPGQSIVPLSKSPHANGRAVDINPVENPWRDPECDCWSPSARHRERRPGKGVIVAGGVAWWLFLGEGWRWQIGGERPDYMHFDTGYPSYPYRRFFHRQAG